MLNVKHYAGLALLAAGMCHAASDDIVIRENKTEQVLFSPEKNGQYLDMAQAQILSRGDARGLLSAASAMSGVVKENRDNPGYGTAKDFSNFDASDFYCLIHVVKWAKPAEDAQGLKALQVDKQNWYVYHAGQAWRQEDFRDNKRLFGSRNVWLLFIHTNIAGNYSYIPQYDVNLKDITPAPLDHLLGLVKLFTGSAGETPPPPYAIWGAHNITVQHLPNEMTITAEAVELNDNQFTAQRMGDSVTFVNEGRYHYDFSVAIPITKVSQLNVDQANGAVTANNVDRQNMYALLDLYPWKNEVRNQTFSLYPYFIAGAAIAKQPLHKILVGLGYGPKFAQFYFGALFVKQDQLNGLTPGQVATSGQISAVKTQGFEPQFSFGLNLSVRAINDLLKKKN